MRGFWGAAKLRVVSVVALGVISGCKPDKEPVEPPRPVRTVAVERREQSEVFSLTGQIRARQEVNVAFRLSGRVIARPVNVGDHVTNGQVVAQLDPQIQRDAVTSASAALNSAQGMLAQVSASFQRQKDLLAKGFTTRAVFDQAQQQLNAATAQVSASQAQLNSAQEQLGYTDLRANAAGTVTATGAEPGEVVSAGQMVIQVAQADGRDAVFDVPATLLRTAPRDIPVNLVLTDDQTVIALGHVREVAPQANPTTRMFQVKVGLDNPPDAMRLGATVVGSIKLASGPTIAIPASALTQDADKPAVWIVSKDDMSVSLKHIEVLRYDPDQVIISSGLEPGDVVVTAGVQALRPAQKVRLLGDNP